MKIREYLNDGFFDKFKKNKISINVGDFVSLNNGHIVKIEKISDKKIYAQIDMERWDYILIKDILDITKSPSFTIGHSVKENGRGLVKVGRIYSIYTKGYEVIWNDNTYSIVKERDIK